MRIIEAFKAFFRVLSGAEDGPVRRTPEHLPEIPEKKVEQKKHAEDKSRDDYAEGAVWTLNMLQREGRLVDFLQEDISACDDEQVGAAVRQIHRSCAKVLAEHFNLDRIARAEEGSEFTAPDNFSPMDFKMTGNVPDSPPFKGILRHRGWQVGKLNLPERTGKGNVKIIQSAEISFEEI